MNKITLVATSAFGIESVLADEVKRLGFEQVEVFNGYVQYASDIKGICQSNLWLRTAERVFIKIGSFKAETFEELFQGVKALPWEKWISKDGEFPVNGKSVKSKLFSVSDCQAITKKAIVERLKAHYDEQWFSETGPKMPILVSLLKDEVSLLIDTSGEGLHKRGYRLKGNEAPLKETLGAALVKLSRWKGQHALMDPFCGTGTILIEAAMIASNIAPGLNRKFISETWGLMDEALWREERKQAYGAIDHAQELKLMGYDMDPKAIQTARMNAEEAGVEDLIEFNVQAFEDLNISDEPGVIVTNPPYGERMGSTEDVKKLYQTMGRKLKSKETWALNVITAFEGFETVYGMKALKNRKVYNGRIKCYYYQYPAAITQKKKNPK